MELSSENNIRNEFLVPENPYKNVLHAYLWY